MLIQVNNENFKAETSSGVTLVDFYADWCGPCKMIAPILEEIANDRNDFNILKLNVDENREISMQYGVSSIPTLLVLKDGVEVGRHIGFAPKPALIQIVEKHL
ncbi:thioredoxin [Mycoplasmatota bacterium]|nr:thioredoxin [Mycoplasmatota bacterium]